MAANDVKIVLSADDKTKSAFDSAQRNLQGLTAAAGSLNGALAGIGVSLSVGAFASFVKTSIDAADNLNDLSKKTGVAVENLAGLQLVVDKSGTTMEMLGNGISKLNKTLGEASRGSKEAQAILKDLGITASDPMEAFYQLADAFGRFRTEGEKASAMSQIIGKTWGELAPALAEGSAGLRAMVEDGKRLNPITKEMADQADKFNDALSRFKTQASGVGTTIANALLPAMNEMLARWNDAITLASRHGGFINVLMGGVNPTGTNSANLKNVRDEIAAIQLQLKDAGTAQGDIAGINGPRLRARLAELESIKRTLLEIQQREALAANDRFGTADYKQAKAPGRPSISFTDLTDKKSKKQKDRVSEAEWAMEEAAHLTRTYYQIGQEMDKAAEAAFERASESASEWQESLDRANTSLRESAAGYIDLIDPIEKYRRQLDEIQQLLDAGLLTQDQATEATFRIQEQIDAVAGFGEELKKTKSIAEELGLTFSSAFEDAIVKGSGFRDILQGIYQDILRITVRRTVTEPLAEGFSGLLKGIDFASMIPKFASGTDYVPRDMVAVVHKGEAIIPAGQNRGGGITINMVVNTPDASSFSRSRGQIQADLAFAVQGARRFA